MIATLVQVADPTRTVPSTVNVIMGLIVSALFGAAVRGGWRRNGDDD